MNGKGTNKVPDIKTFVRNLDREKQERDQRLDEQRRQAGADYSEAKPHKETKAGKEGTRRTVHDPTTQKEVQIEDVDMNFMKAVEDPQVITQVERQITMTYAKNVLPALRSEREYWKKHGGNTPFSLMAVG